MLWDCQEVKRFWEGVRDCLRSIVEDDVIICPEVCLLGAKVDSVGSDTM